MNNLCRIIMSECRPVEGFEWTTEDEIDTNFDT